MAHKTHIRTLPAPLADEPTLLPDPRQPNIDAIATTLLTSTLTADQVDTIHATIQGTIRNTAHRSALLRR